MSQIIELSKSYVVNIQQCPNIIIYFFHKKKNLERINQHIFFSIRKKKKKKKKLKFDNNSLLNLIFYKIFIKFALFHATQ